MHPRIVFTTRHTQAPRQEPRTLRRPIMEYGSVAIMGAKQTHFAKFDQIQTTDARIGRFKVESLSSRREAAAIALTSRLLDGKGKGVLKT
jgi:hypothetical protein